MPVNSHNALEREGKQNLKKKIKFLNFMKPVHGKFSLHFKIAILFLKLLEIAYDTVKE